MTSLPTEVAYHLAHSSFVALEAPCIHCIRLLKLIVTLIQLPWSSLQQSVLSVLHQPERSLMIYWQLWSDDVEGILWYCYKSNLAVFVVAVRIIMLSWYNDWLPTYRRINFSRIQTQRLCRIDATGPKTSHTTRVSGGAAWHHGLGPMSSLSGSQRQAKPEVRSNRDQSEHLHQIHGTHWWKSSEVHFWLLFPSVLDGFTTGI